VAEYERRQDRNTERLLRVTENTIATFGTTLATSETKGSHCLTRSPLGTQQSGGEAIVATEGKTSDYTRDERFERDTTPFRRDGSEFDRPW